MSMLGGLFPVSTYMFIFISLVRTGFLQKLCVGQKVISFFFPTITQADIFHVPINCESKPKMRFPILTKHCIFIHACQILVKSEFLSHTPFHYHLLGGKWVYVLFPLIYLKIHWCLRESIFYMLTFISPFAVLYL